MRQRSSAGTKWLSSWKSMRRDPRHAGKSQRLIARRLVIHPLAVGRHLRRRRHEPGRRLTVGRRRGQESRRLIVGRRQETGRSLGAARRRREVGRPLGAGRSGGKKMSGPCVVEGAGACRMDGSGKAGAAGGGPMMAVSGAPGKYGNGGWPASLAVGCRDGQRQGQDQRRHSPATAPRCASGWRRALLCLRFGLPWTGPLLAKRKEPVEKTR